MSLVVEKMKNMVRILLDTNAWKVSHVRVVLRDYMQCYDASMHSNHVHMLAALEWLRHAQEATGNGGVAGRYQMNKGFTDAYPETSGHIISTLIKSGYFFHDDSYIDMAGKIIDFLLSVQMDSGAYQRGEYIPGAGQIPAVFNTGQIMLGLIAWYHEKKDQKVLDALVRSADWLLSVQEPDGSWEKYTYGSVKPTNYTRVAWPLLLFSQITSDVKYEIAASKFIDWFLTNANFETGWVDNMGFSKEDHEAKRSLTHTLAYAYRGLFEYGILSKRDNLIELVKKASQQIIDSFYSSDFISGVYDSDWKGIADYTCLTGNCQLSVIWLKLFRYYDDDYFYSAAQRAMDQVKSYQILDTLNKGIRGAIAGSKPVWGGYITNAYPNWAAKFFIDALLLLEQADAGANPYKYDYKFFEKE